MRTYGGGSLNAVVKYGGVQALKDTAYEKKIKQMTIELRRSRLRTCALGLRGDPVGNETSYGRCGQGCGRSCEDFKKRKVLVGRKFPPMNNWLRVSVGTNRR